MEGRKERRAVRTPTKRETAIDIFNLISCKFCALCSLLLFASSNFLHLASSPLPPLLLLTTQAEHASLHATSQPERNKIAGNQSIWPEVERVQCKRLAYSPLICIVEWHENFSFFAQAWRAPAAVRARA